VLQQIGMRDVDEWRCSLPLAACNLQLTALAAGNVLEWSFWAGAEICGTSDFRNAFWIAASGCVD